mmetsp:Transcript_21112/g.58468  ORF Transcript_21112/g.58468 Transcript_21112/m.58468 type:complete len:129 (-) Transcript_21112:3435-3821(-)
MPLPTFKPLSQRIIHPFSMAEERMSQQQQIEIENTNIQSKARCIEDSSMPILGSAVARCFVSVDAVTQIARGKTKGAVLCSCPWTIVLVTALGETLEDDASKTKDITTTQTLPLPVDRKHYTRASMIM